MCIRDSRMYHVAERKGWSDEARAYTALVVAWTDLARGAESARGTQPAQTSLGLEAEKGPSAGSSDPNDPQFLLNAIWFRWQDTLGKTLGMAEKNYVAELRLT